MEKESQESQDIRGSIDDLIPQDIRIRQSVGAASNIISPSQHGLSLRRLSEKTRET